MSQMLFSESPLIRIETCWAFSNLISEGGDFLTICTNIGVLSNISKLLMNCDDNAFSLEGLICLRNAALVGTSLTLEHLIQPGTIEAICDKMDCTNENPTKEQARAALEAFEAILQLGARHSGEGNEVVNYIIRNNLCSKVESVQKHSDPEMLERILRVLNSYFKVEESS